MKLVVGALALTNAALLAGLSVGPAGAHTGSTHFRTWASNHSESYYWDDDVPTGLRPAITFGLQQWSNEAGGRAPAFTAAGQVNAEFDYGRPCAGTLSTVYVRGDLEQATGGAIGATILCPSEAPLENLRIDRFNLLFDETPGGTPWYAGSTQPPTNRWDLRSIATHESGHVAGFVGPGRSGHFYESDDGACPTAVSTRNTMCPGRQAELGTIWLRSLDAHDLHTIRTAY